MLKVNEIFSNKLFLGALLLIVSSGLIYWVNSMLGEPDVPHKKTVQTITVFTPPEPPEIEPPEIEEPEIEEEEIVPELEEMPDLPSEESPPGPDIEAGPGPGVPVGGGKSGPRGDPGQRYAQYVVRNEIYERLIEAGVMSRRYQTNIQVWVNDEGKLVKFKLLEPTGDRKLDKKIKKVLASFGYFSKPPVDDRNVFKIAVNAQ